MSFPKYKLAKFCAFDSYCQGKMNEPLTSADSRYYIHPWDAMARKSAKLQTPCE
jgi:hypothetical protein